MFSDISLLILSEFSDDESDEENLLDSSTDLGSSSEEDEYLENLLCDSYSFRRHHAENITRDAIPTYTNKEFQIHFRVNRNVYNFLIEKFKDSEDYKSLRMDKVISADTHIALFLWFAGHRECSFRDIANRFHISISTVSAIISRVTHFISSLSDAVIKWPNYTEKLTSSAFFAAQHIGGSFEEAIGVLGMTHIRIIPPKSDKNQYINWKGESTIQVLGICNERNDFIYIFAGLPGAVHVHEVLERSDIYPKLSSLCGDYYILANSSFACTENIITPYIDNEQLGARQKKFNDKLNASRIIIEHAFTMLKRRFPQLYFCKLKGVEKVCHFVRACVVLHNLCDENFIRVGSDFKVTDINQDMEPPNTTEMSIWRRNQLCYKMFRSNAK
ncbi:putative nuclease HARBI1 [Teleopsis dalmanni]|uniref:putative nuclease HARBI1 n=1 Tax=Teleopsis dalmanni TaxID=139649 RepID=UPI0018CD3F8D|nr:putative nuclease HARBI1 [Teleopsis dalmanni]